MKIDYATLALLIVLLALLIFLVFMQIPKKEGNKEFIEGRLYQGPVQEGYNETHFRQTGEYVKNGNPN
jgi:hypothetical protein